MFQALADGKSAGGCEVFADGFAGKVKSPEMAQHRPTGIAGGLDGALFVSDDVRGRIYRIEYRGGGSAETGAAGTPCPSATAPPGSAAAAEAEPPEGTHPDAGGAAGIRSTITQGVAQPKKYRAPMPPMGGAQLTSEQVSAVAAYVWVLSHRSP